MAQSRLTSAAFSTSSARGRLLDAAMSTTAARGRVLDATVTTSATRGSLLDATVATTQPRGRLLDATITTVPAVIGWFGVGGQWVQVGGYLGVAQGGGTYTGSFYGDTYADGYATDTVASVVWVPVKRYTGPTTGGGGPVDPPPPPPPPPPVSTRGPVRFDTVEEARVALGAPNDANYVTWDPLWTTQGLMLHEVFSTKMAANDILVLPERVDNAGVAIPYLIDSSKGFMAPTPIASITGSLPSDTAGTRIPIQNGNNRCWFQMARGRRGIIGLGPNSVIQPSVSSFSRPAQPITEQTGGVMKAYNSAGTALQDLVGAQDMLMGFDYEDNNVGNAFVGNVTFRSRDLGGVAYSTIRASHVVNVLFDASSRGHAGVPNGETGCVNIGSGSRPYRIENVEVITTDSTGASVVTSPFMWNRGTAGGTMKNVKTGKPRAGMPTFWRCNGTQTWTDVDIYGNDVGLNLEEGGSAFVLNWTGGSLRVTNRYHIVGESSGGSKKINLNNVQVIPGVGPANTLMVSIYSYSATYVQKKSDITRTGLQSGPVTVVGFAL